MEQGFEYHSGKNPRFLTIEEIVAMNHLAAHDDSLRPPGDHPGGHRRGGGGPAVGLPDAGAGGSRVRGGRRAARGSTTRPRHEQRHLGACTSPAWRWILDPGTCLWTVPNTFVASANCGRYCGADVDFVDIDPRTWNLSVPKLREKLCAAKAAGRLPKVLIPVHFAGQPTEQEAIWELAREYGFRVIEDASHAIGAERNGEPVGSCRWSDITVFSFHPVKIITTGEGGMALTNDAALAARMALFRSHGITRDPAGFAAIRTRVLPGTTSSSCSATTTA